jgi:hypothetical protein
VGLSDELAASQQRLVRRCGWSGLKERERECELSGWG